MKATIGSLFRASHGIFFPRYRETSTTALRVFEYQTHDSAYMITKIATPLPREMPKPRPGVGAKGTCLVRFVHPTLPLRDRYLNTYKTERLGGWFVRGREHKVIRNREVLCYTIQHESFNDTDLTFYVSVKNFTITEEGPLLHLFSGTAATHAEGTAQAQNTAQAGTTNQQQDNEYFPLDNDDMMERLQAEGFSFDRDDLPLGENIPHETDPVPTVFTQWGFNGTDYRIAAGAINFLPRFTNIDNALANELSTMDVFLLFFPTDFIKTVVLPAMNRSLTASRYKETNYGEFIKFIGIILFMSTYDGCSRHDWWSSQPISIEYGAPYRLHQFMSGKRFHVLNQALTFTDMPTPTYLDKFYPVRQMIDAFNANMARKFHPGWVCCLDESMMEWTERWSCPGWMYVPRKPTPAGNEYHTICCGICGVLFHLELVYAKDHPPQRGQLEFENLGGKTIGLLLRMTKPIWGFLRMVIMDSGFCVLSGLVQLRKKGVFASALIKKRKYWPRFIPGEAIQNHMKNKNVGEVDCMQGTLDNVPCNVFCLKEPEYIGMIMSTCGSNLEVLDHKTARRVIINGSETQISFNYTVPFSWHYNYRHQVDDHNQRRQGTISVEKGFDSRNWSKRVFTFIIGVAEVNAYKMKKYLSGGEFEMQQLHFRRRLALEMIHNRFISERIGRESDDSDDEVENHENIQHIRMTKPQYTGKWNGTTWATSTLKYLQSRCCKCGKKTRIYCSCSKLHFYCTDCFILHLVDVQNEV